MAAILGLPLSLPLSLSLPQSAQAADITITDNNQWTQDNIYNKVNGGDIVTIDGDITTNDNASTVRGSMTINQAKSLTLGTSLDVWQNLEVKGVVTVSGGEKGLQVREFTSVSGADAEIRLSDLDIGTGLNTFGGMEVSAGAKVSLERESQLYIGPALTVKGEGSSVTLVGSAAEKQAVLTGNRITKLMVQDKGSVTVGSYGKIALSSVTVNGAGSILTLQENATFEVSSTTIENSGLLQAEAHDLQFNANQSLRLESGGKAYLKTVEISAGSIGVDGVGSALSVSGATTLKGSSASLVVQGGSFSSGTLSMEQGAKISLSGEGTVRATSITVKDGTSTLAFTDNTGTLKADSLNVTGGLTVTGSGRLEAGSVTLKDGGLLNVAADGSMDSKLFNFDGGTYKGTLTLNDPTAVLNAHRPVSGMNLVDGALNVQRGVVNLGTDTLAGQLKVTGDVTFGASSTLAVNLAKVEQGANPVLTGAGNNKLNVDKGSVFKVTGGKQGTYQISKDFVGGTTNGAWTSVDTTSLALRVKGKWDSAGQIYTVVLGYTDPLPGASGPVTDMLQNVITQLGVDPDSPNMGHRLYSRAMDERYAGNNAGEGVRTLESAARVSVAGAAAANTMASSQAGTGAALSRVSMVTPVTDSSRSAALHLDQNGFASLDSLSGLSAGGEKGGSSLKNGAGVWIMPLYQSNKVWGMDAGGGLKSGYDSDLGGIAVGADYTFADMFRLGLAVNMGAGSSRSNGDLNDTFNRFNFWGLNAYGGWFYNNFALSADVGFSNNFSSMEQDVPSSFQMSSLKSNVNSRAWSAGFKGEYKFETSLVDIIPHVGLRYTGLTTDGHSIKSGGSTVHDVEQSFQSIWTFPVGVSFARSFETASGWSVRPQLDLTVIPAAGDVKAKSRVSVPGVAGTAQSEMQITDYVTYEGGLGLEMKKDNFSVGLNYTLQASEHRTGHMVFGTLRYEF